MHEPFANCLLRRFGNLIATLVRSLNPNTERQRRFFHKPDFCIDGCGISNLIDAEIGEQKLRNVVTEPDHHAIMAN